MAEQKTCKQCQKTFVVEDEDLELLKKVSPSIAGRTFDLPLPTLCVECRMCRRLSWRNERTLYKRKCDLCQKDIVALYHQNSRFKIYCQECFWSDKWDQYEFAQEIDFNRSVLEQMKEIQAKQPRIALLNSRSENSEFANHASRNKDCYLVFASFDNENVMFARRARNTTNSMEIDVSLKNCQYCYECLSVENCYRVKYSNFCVDCSESYFLNECIGCKNCYRCSGLRNKQYYFENKQLTKEEYEKALPDLGSGKIVDEEKKKFREFIKSVPQPYAHITNSENCTGDEILNSKNCKFAFDIEHGENCKYFDNGENVVYAVDIYGVGFPGEYLYEVHGMLDGHYSAFCHASYYCSRSFFADNCQNCQDVFACVGLKKAQYCILNKQYSKEEYEKAVTKLIEKMTQEGEWGEFFPINMSPFGYNESVANEYFPASKQEVEKLGANWQVEDNTPPYTEDSYEPKDNIAEYKNSEAEQKKLLEGIIKCSVSGKPFKIVPRELAFYLENDIPITNKHFDIRHRERFRFRNPRKLYHRKCMNGDCPNEFETTYAPDRPEKIYCESCYQKVVI